MVADVGACHLNHELATTLFFFANKHQNDEAVVHEGLTFLCMEEINRHLETTLSAWPYCTHISVCMDREKLKQHQTLRLDQLTDMLNKTTCLTGHLTASLQVHITWGRPRILFEKKYLDYLQGRKLIAHSGQSSWWTPKFNSYFHCFHQPNCFLKYKIHWLCLVE